MPNKSFPDFWPEWVGQKNGKNLVFILQLEFIAMSFLKGDITIVVVLFLISYSLVTKFEICLKYFLDKNSQKQP